jgi:hypothetical protein
MMAIFVLAAGGFATLIGYVAGLPIAAAPFVFGALLVYAMFSYYASASVALAVSSAHAVTREDEPELYRVVENLSIGSGLPMPKVYVIEDSAPNAFATGRDPSRAALAVTSELLEQLDREELQGVVAHEVSHIRNLDSRYGCSSPCWSARPCSSPTFFGIATFPFRMPTDLPAFGTAVSPGSGQVSGPRSGGGWSFPSIKTGQGW